MTAAEQEQEYVWPRTWPYHDHPHDTQACLRCQREADWIEDHLTCDCLHWPWDRVDQGAPATPRPVWVCSACLRVQGPAYDGGGA